MTRRIKLATALHGTIDKRRLAAVAPAVGGTQHPVTANAARGFGFPALGRALASVVYGAGYYTSFGIVFSAMTVLHLLPLNNPLGRGFREGGQAGAEAFSKWRAAGPGRAAQAGRSAGSAVV